VEENQNTPSQNTPEPNIPRTPLTKLSIIVFGVIVLLILAGIYVLLTTTSTNQATVSEDISSEESSTVISRETRRNPTRVISPMPSIVQPTKVPIEPIEVTDTVSFITPKGWRENSSANTNPSFLIYETIDFTLDTQSNKRLSGAAFTIFVRPNDTRRTAKSLLTARQKELDNPTAVIEQIQIGNRQGSYSILRSEGLSHAYFVADTRYVWEIQFSCPDICTNPVYLNDRKAFLDSLVFN
jgi:hypothetical protein